MGQGQIVQSIVVAIVTAFASLIIHLFVNARTIFYNRKDFYIKDIATRLEKSEGILGDVNDSMDDISDLLTDIELLQEDQSAGRDTSTAFIARYDFSYYSNLSSSNLSIYRNSEKIRQAVAELRQAVRTGRTAIAEYNSSKTPADDLAYVSRTVVDIQSKTVDLKQVLLEAHEQMRADHLDLEKRSFRIFGGNDVHSF